MTEENPTSQPKQFPTSLMELDESEYRGLITPRWDSGVLTSLFNTLIPTGGLGGPVSEDHSQVTMNTKSGVLSLLSVQVIWQLGSLFTRLRTELCERGLLPPRTRRMRVLDTGSPQSQNTANAHRGSLCARTTLMVMHTR